MDKIYYFVSNSDNQIHKTDESDLFKIEEKWDNITIQVLTSEGEVIDEVIGYKSLGDLMDVVYEGGNDLE